MTESKQFQRLVERARELNGASEAYAQSILWSHGNANITDIKRAIEIARTKIDLVDSK